MLGLKDNAEDIVALKGLCAISGCQDSATETFVSIERSLPVCRFHLDVLEHGLSLW